MLIFTNGLPDGTNPTQRYQFNALDRHIYIPSDYVGRDQVGEVHFPEQAAWLNSLAPTIPIKEVWYGVWECDTKEDLEKIIELLQKIS